MTLLTRTCNRRMSNTSKLVVSSAFVCLVVVLLLSPLQRTIESLLYSEAQEKRNTDKIHSKATSISSQVGIRNDGSDTLRGDPPVTDFTPHILQLLELVDLDNECVAAINLTVTTPNSIPQVECPPKGAKDVGKSWCTILKRTFIEQNRTLPSSVTLSFSRTDKRHKHLPYRCFESSSENGEFCVTNYLEAGRMKDEIEYPIILWENRSSIPIWRGTPWMNLKKGEEVTDPTKVYEDALSRSPRLQAVAWSFDHPDLLDAKIGKLQRLSRHPYWEKRAVNGMDKLYPVDSFISRDDYYTQYQVAVVLGGIGAAFRTSIHLSTETAVVLQEWPFKEWFTPMMKPYEHYIPLAEDLSDLYETMQWVQGNPTKVRQVAKTGKQFYERYLSFEKNQEHIAELAIRMALLKSERDSKETNRTLQDVP